MCVLNLQSSEEASGGLLVRQHVALDIAEERRRSVAQLGGAFSPRTSAAGSPAAGQPPAAVAAMARSPPGLLTERLPCEDGGPSGQLPADPVSLLGPADAGWHAAQPLSSAVAAYGRGSEVPIAATTRTAGAAAMAARESIMHVLGAPQVWRPLPAHLAGLSPLGR